MDKQLIYEQIDAFNDTLFNKDQPKNGSIEKARLFVPKDVAADRSNFLKFLFEQHGFLKTKKATLKNVLDIAFGSGNLTSHLLLDNDIAFDNVLFNDLNLDKSNKDIAALFQGKAEVTDLDFLNLAQFEELGKYDFFVFNPQTGGNSTYPAGNSKLSVTSRILFPGEIEEYLSEQKIDSTDFEITHPSKSEILIESKEMSKSDLSNELKNIKIFNFKDVFFKGKTGNQGGVESNIAKFRATFDEVFNDKGLLAFFGDRALFDCLFGDFNTVFDYWANDGKGVQHFLIATKSDTPLSICYEKSGHTFIEILNCQKDTTLQAADGDLDALESSLKDLFKELDNDISEDSLFSSPQTEAENTEQSQETPQKSKKTPFILRGTSFGNLSFPYKNILLKGVPGTGKSRLINESFIKRQLGFPKKTHANILRINIHSASSNADLMQGIGIATKGGNIEYGEKQGLILHHLKSAIAQPYAPFVIVLEEIQENSLNELIGDLIYLIEDDKRVNIQEFIEEGPFRIDQEFASLDDFLDELTALDDGIHFVEIPYLVSNETIYRKLIIPNNLYFFCTSNYRDDKKIIEDNLLRRFELIEIYPKYTPDVIGNQEVAAFLKTLNKSIITHFNKSETHPDRFMIGHAAWINVGNDDAAFCRAFLKAITEFKDIREIEFKDIEPILKDLKTLPSFVSKSEEILRGSSYKTIIETLQKRAYGDILNG
jgi:5-methylcytosine-specific restriction enzyme B